MSLIEGDASYYPLFNTSEIPPLDFTVPTNFTDSPGFRHAKKFSTNNNDLQPQIVPGGASLHQPDEPLFQLFMSGGIDKLEFPLNATLLKGLQMTDDILLQSGLIHKTQLTNGEMHSGMDVKFPPCMISDAGVVPDFMNHISKANIGSDEPSKGNNQNKKRKFAQSPSPKDMLQPPSPIDDSPISLSPEDERNAKRQRRLVKNREAAQLFRQRQKAYIQDLEKRVGDLTASNNDFRARVELLNSENKLIKEQLIYLRNFITQGPGSPNGAGPTMSPGPNSSGSPNSMGNGMSIPLPPGLNMPPGMFGMNVPNMSMLSGMNPNYGGPMQMPPNFSMGMAPMPPNMMQQMSHQGHMMTDVMMHMGPSSPHQDVDDKSKVKILK